VNYLVDTHVLLWSFLETDKLSNEIKSILLNDNNEIYYSPISLWEISVDLITNYKLPNHHKDPFDRFLIWEAIKSDFVLISVDESMKLYKKEGLKIAY
jgi:PIN domain nuclease of toxin-antitoxin system